MHRFSSFWTFWKPFDPIQHLRGLTFWILNFWQNWATLGIYPSYPPRVAPWYKQTRVYFQFGVHSASLPKGQGILYRELTLCLINRGSKKKKKNSSNHRYETSEDEESERHPKPKRSGSRNSGTDSKTNSLKRRSNKNRKKHAKSPMPEYNVSDLGMDLIWIKIQ